MESSSVNPSADRTFSQATDTCAQRYYLLLKGHYFLFFSAFGMLYPILSITLRSRGLSTTEISLMNLIIPFAVFFSNPLMGFAADKSRRFQLTFNVLLAIVTILYAILFYLPSIQNDHIQATIINNQNDGYQLKFCASQEMGTKCASRSECGCSYYANCIFSNNDNLSFEFHMNANETHEQLRTSIDVNRLDTCNIDYYVAIDTHIVSSQRDDLDRFYSIANNDDRWVRCRINCSIEHFCHGKRHPKQMTTILFYACIFIVGTNLLSNTITLGVSIGFATLPRSDLFGRQRVWGTIGFGLSAFAASRFYAHFKTEFVYIIMFSITTMLCILLTSMINIPIIKHQLNTRNYHDRHNEQEMDDISSKIPGQQTREDKKRRLSSKFNVTTLLPLLKRIDVLVFLSLTLIWGMSYAGLDPVCMINN
jgi:hypothetical protein